MARVDFPCQHKSQQWKFHENQFSSFAYDHINRVFLHDIIIIRAYEAVFY